VCGGGGGSGGGVCVLFFSLKFIFCYHQLLIFLYYFMLKIEDFFILFYCQTFNSDNQDGHSIRTRKQCKYELK
jgi:hypothetical protein